MHQNKSSATWVQMKPCSWFSVLKQNFVPIVPPYLTLSSVVSVPQYCRSTVVLVLRSVWQEVTSPFPPQTPQLWLWFCLSPSWRCWPSWAIAFCGRAGTGPAEAPPLPRVEWSHRSSRSRTRWCTTAPPNLCDVISSSKPDVSVLLAPKYFRFCRFYLFFFIFTCCFDLVSA